MALPSLKRALGIKDAFRGDDDGKGAFVGGREAGAGDAHCPSVAGGVVCGVVKPQSLEEQPPTDVLRLGGLTEAWLGLDQRQSAGGFAKVPFLSRARWEEKWM